MISNTRPTIQPCTAVKDPDIRREFEKLIDWLNDNIKGGIVPADAGVADPTLKLANDDLVVDHWEGSIRHVEALAAPAQRISVVGNAHLLHKIISGGPDWYTVQQTTPDCVSTWGPQFLAFDVNAAAPAVGDAVMVTWQRDPSTGAVVPFFLKPEPRLSGYSGLSGRCGFSGVSGFSGFSGLSGTCGYSGAGAALVYASPAAVDLVTPGDGIETSVTRSDHVHRIKNQTAAAYHKLLCFDSTGNAIVDWMRAF